MSYFIAYDFEFLISSENYRERILDFDVTFMRSAHRYGLMHLGDIAIEQFLSDYRSMREQDFFREEYKNYLLFDIGQLNKLFSRNYNPNISVCYRSLDSYFVRDGEVIEKCMRFCNVSSDATYVHDVAHLDTWEENTALSLLLDNEDIYNMPYDEKVAYIPRFNSLLRDICHFVKEMGGTMSTECMFEEFATPDGFLLNGRIIYQDDIESGKEPFPIAPPPYIEYWLERDIT